MGSKRCKQIYFSLSRRPSLLPKDTFHENHEPCLNITRRAGCNPQTRQWTGNDQKQTFPVKDRNFDVRVRRSSASINYPQTPPTFCFCHVGQSVHNHNHDHFGRSASQEIVKHGRRQHFGGRRRTPTPASSFRDRYLKYLSVSSLEYNFQPSAILWTLYPTIILLIFHTRSGVWRSKGGGWMRTILNIIENESTDATRSTISGLDFEAEEKLRRGTRIGLIINLIMVTIRGTLLLTLGTIIPTPVFMNDQTPLFAILWLCPQILWLYYSSFLMLISIFFLECVSNYFVASFEIINRMIREVIASADDTKIVIDRSSLLR